MYDSGQKVRGDTKFFRANVIENGSTKCVCLQFSILYGITVVATTYRAMKMKYDVSVAFC